MKLETKFLCLQIPVQRSPAPGELHWSSLPNCRRPERHRNRATACLLPIRLSAARPPLVVRALADDFALKLWGECSASAASDVVMLKYRVTDTKPTPALIEAIQEPGEVELRTGFG